MKKYMGNKLAILLFVLPALAIFITFDFIPIIQVFAYSFTDWNGLTMPNFTGLKNYLELFTDRVFYTSNRNQLIFAIVITVYQMFFATVFAITISDKKMKGRKFLRVAYFIPSVSSGAQFSAERDFLISSLKLQAPAFHRTGLETDIKPYM